MHWPFVNATEIETSILSFTALHCSHSPLSHKGFIWNAERHLLHKSTSSQKTMQ